MPEAARAVERGALAAWLAAPVPEGLAAVHPGWIRRVFEPESSAVLRAVAPGLPAEVVQVADEVLRARGRARDEDIDEDLERRGAEGPGVAAARRRTFAALAPLPTSGGPPLARALCALPGTALLDEIDRRGAETLGRALSGAPDVVVARAAAGVGATLAHVVLAAAKAGADAAARAAARALVAAAPTDGIGAARAVGLRAVARQVGHEGAAALTTVAQRLPPALGEALLACAGVG
ncbi:MAG TPA: hypothetical protein VLA14_05170 [Polyangia bacterium]|nr:hypothetical protein [Polyangia bacterium]